MFVCTSVFTFFAFFVNIINLKIIFSNNANKGGRKLSFKFRKFIKILEKLLTNLRGYDSKTQACESRSQKHFDQKSNLGNLNHFASFSRTKADESVLKLGFFNHLITFPVCKSDFSPIFPDTEQESFTAFGI